MIETNQPKPPPVLRRIVVIDNHDSFVHTIVGYLRALGAHVDVIRNDDAAVWRAVRDTDGVLISPGPGAPQGAGASLAMVAHCAEMGLPLLGVCLGHQAIAEHFGGEVVLAPRVMHGRTSDVTHDGQGVFAGLANPVTVTRYHSLAVANSSITDPLVVTSATVPTPAEPQPVIMGLRHRDLPIESVQFHPEAILSIGGMGMLRNWLAQA